MAKPNKTKSTKDNFVEVKSNKELNNKKLKNNENTTISYIYN